MKKLLVIAALTLFTLSESYAQESMFNMGDKVVSLGVGIGSTYYSGLYYRVGVPPLSIQYEQAIQDEVLENGVIGVGGYLGYSSSRYRYDYLGFDYGWNYSSIILGAIGSFHYPVIDDLDTYAGVLLGYRLLTTREYGDVPANTTTSANPGVAFSGYVGGRYYFNDNFAVFAQLGYGIAYLTFGVNFKL